MGFFPAIVEVAARRTAETEVVSRRLTAKQVHFRMSILLL
jgi:hypothetical protein